MDSHCRLLSSAILVATLSLLLPQDVFSQIPADCSDAESLENSVCCPTTADGVCGTNANRGTCVTLNFAGYSNETSDVRTNWPHYFTQVCECNGNFAGHDCGRCKFGYYGSDCSQKQVLPRRPIRELTNEEWIAFNDVIRRTRTYDSGYKVVLEESTPGNASLVVTNISLYHLYIWIHHYTAKDSQDLGNVLRCMWAWYISKCNLMQGFCQLQICHIWLHQYIEIVSTFGGDGNVCAWL